jgi:hypothetical protein
VYVLRPSDVSRGLIDGAREDDIACMMIAESSLLSDQIIAVKPHRLTWITEVP